MINLDELKNEEDWTLSFWSIYNIFYKYAEKETENTIWKCDLYNVELKYFKKIWIEDVLENWYEVWKTKSEDKIKISISTDYAIWFFKYKKIF